MCNTLQLSVTGTSSEGDILRLSTSYCVFVSTYDVCLWILPLQSCSQYTQHTKTLFLLSAVSSIKRVFIYNVPLDVFVPKP